MIDWVEGHHKLKELVGELYEAMLKGMHGEAKDICNQIVIEARLTKAQIGAQHDKQQGGDH